MNKVCQFLQDCGTFFVATTENGNPKVRPFGFCMIYDNKLCIASSNKKAFFKQIAKNPRIEICGQNGINWMRLSGIPVVCTTEEAQTKALELTPTLAKMYAVGDNDFEIIAIENGIANFYSLSGEYYQLAL